MTKDLQPVSDQPIALLNDTPLIPRIIAEAGDDAIMRFAEFFTAEIRTPHTRQAYGRALIGLMLYSFARIGATLATDVEDLFYQHNRLWLRLHEKGGKHHEMPAHHNLEFYLRSYLSAAGFADEKKTPLFRTIDQTTKALSERRLERVSTWAMVRRRAAKAGISTEVCNHTFRGTGITVYMHNGGRLETAAEMAAHASTRTTQLYNRVGDAVSLDEVERIII